MTPRWRLGPTLCRLFALGTLAALSSVLAQPSEADALLALRASITNWEQFTAANAINGWGSPPPAPAPPCQWTGVTCDDQGRVMALRLACDQGCTVKAVGTLPPSLASLQTLVSVDLRSNAFRGGLPPEWAAPAAFPALQALYLADNALEGPIPWSCAAFPQLQLLRLDNNRLGGAWPPTLVLPAATVVRAHDNALTGPLSPSLFSIQLPRARIVSFQSNQIGGGLPPEWAAPGAAQELAELYLQGNALRWGLPDVWGAPPAFPSLGTLSLDNNTLGGELPAREQGIALDVAKALAYLHSRKIVHFDVKSSNVLLARDGTAKLGDVGMARFMAADYVTGVVATLAWAAPEMLWGVRCTEKADIYSYGIVLWEICTGEAPERGRLRDIRVPQEAPPEVRDLVLECLDSRPGERPSAQQIVERLQALPRAARAPSSPAAAAAAAGEEGAGGGAAGSVERGSSEESPPGQGDAPAEAEAEAPVPPPPQ